MRRLLSNLGIALGVCVMLFVLPGTVRAYCIDDQNGNISDLSQDDCTEGFQWIDGDSSGGGAGTITTIPGLLTAIRSIMNTVVPFLVGLAVFIILYGVFTYISSAGDEEKRTEARQFVVWGVVGVFIMVSVWGLVNILVNTLPTRKTPVEVQSIFPDSTDDSNTGE